MRAALAAHDTTLRQAIAAAKGFLFKHTGDGVMAAFASPRAAIEAAVTAQRRLELPVRMGVCTGEAERRDDDYFGPPVNRAARIMAAGHGGQILLASSTAAMLDDLDLVDLGDYRLRGLAQRQRLFQVKADGLRDGFPPLSTLDSNAGNLPTPATGMLGREKELARITSLLDEARLVTLTGVGGVGKTRLMLEAASLVVSNYPDGAWLCELAAMGEPDAVVHTVAAVLGISQQPGQTLVQSLVETLSNRRLLLVLDNCEHLIEPVAALVRQLLSRCPRLSVLATSREALSVEGERAQSVPPLATSAGRDSPAVALFVERACAVASNFDPARDLDSVIEICRRLDGIPLAIELAAARVRAMSARQIRDRLDERFRLLGGSHRALGRHQTLAQAVQWSYDLLNAKERMALARAAVFAGGFTLEGAEAVCAGEGVDSADVLDLVDSLLRKSLLTVEDSGDVARYGMLETIRQFAVEHGSDELEAARARHAAYFAGESDRRFAQWRSPDQVEAYRWLELDMDNLRVAFHWALDRREVDSAARIASNVGDMARFIMREEAANWAAEIVDLARAARHGRLIVLLTWAASSAWAYQRFDETERFAREAIGLLGDAHFEPFVWAYTDLAMVATFKGDGAAASEMVRTGAAHPADAHDRFCAACVPFQLSLIGSNEEAMRVADEALALATTAGVPSSVTLACLGKGLAFAKAEPAKALVALEEGRSIARRSRNHFWEGLIAINIANLQAKAGEPRAALESFRDLMTTSGGLRDAIFVSAGLTALILLFDRLGRGQSAATLNGALPKLIERGANFDELGAAITHTRAVLGDAAVDAAIRRGAAMTLSDASEFARSEIEKALKQLP